MKIHTKCIMKLKYLIIASFLIIGVLIYVKFRKNWNTTFLINQDDNGIEVREKGLPVLFYQKKIKSLKGEFGRNSYIHPLYNLKGEILTEDFPEDHPYHRGVYWAWHQIYVEDSLVSDSWTIDNFNSTITESMVDIKGNTVLLNVTSEWSSPNHLNNVPYLKEKIQLKIHEATTKFRIIDIKLTLNALVDNLKIGGSDNEKGYGGLCLRIKMPDNLSFSSKNGKVDPKTHQIEAGPWMDFSANFGNIYGISGVTLFCHPSNFGFPQKWILRQKASMQNVVFPGQQAIAINLYDPIVLNYRLLVHEGLPFESLVLQEKYYNQNTIQ